jgi:hypothetical protein
MIAVNSKPIISTVYNISEETLSDVMENVIGCTMTTELYDFTYKNL